MGKPRVDYDLDRLYQEAKRPEQESDREKLDAAPERIQAPS
jgi:hypothetical protein